MSARKAEVIVDGILKFIDRVGRFEGSGSNRRLNLKNIIDLKTGKVTPARTCMIKWVKAALTTPGA